MGTRRQMGKGYERHQRYKQQDRDKHTYQKAKKKGLWGLVDEVQQLKEEIITLENARRTDGKIIRDQQAYIEHLETERRRVTLWRASAVFTIAMLSTVIAVLVL